MDNYRIVKIDAAPDGWAIEHKAEDGTLVALSRFDDWMEAKEALGKLQAAQIVEQASKIAFRPAAPPQPASLSAAVHRPTAAPNT